jgi:wyosine [tRNA(Phe)-imidazoG37] synthetase (radical SAM superfamily)
MKMPQHLYGPVLSRRLGLSLGVDITPLKTCSYNCLYCQLGRTTRKTVKRDHFYSPEEILGEIEAALREGAQPDVITFSGSGEPTLNADLGDLIRGVKDLTEIPAAVITNSSLIADPGVQLDLMAAALGRHRHEISKYLGALVEEGKVREKRHAGGTFFMAEKGP